MRVVLNFSGCSVTLLTRSMTLNAYNSALWHHSIAWHSWKSDKHQNLIMQPRSPDAPKHWNKLTVDPGNICDYKFSEKKSAKLTWEYIRRLLKCSKTCWSTVAVYSRGKESDIPAVSGVTVTHVCSSQHNSGSWPNSPPFWDTCWGYLEHHRNGGPKGHDILMFDCHQDDFRQYGHKTWFFYSSYSCFLAQKG